MMGTYLRVSIVLQSEFPLNDGGLFWTMTQNLIQNNFVIPKYTTYNLAQIPYIYPPGAFYLNGLISSFLHIPLVTLFRWMPLLFSILSVLLVYPIAKVILSSSRMAVLATFAFAIIKPSFEWLLMGGGVTRSPAFFFSMCSMLATLQAAKVVKNRKWLILSAISVSITAYFHLETAWITSLVLILLYCYYDLSRRIFSFLAYHLIIGILLFSPYLIMVLQYHEFKPLINAFNSGYHDYSVSLGLIVIPNFTAESIFPILAVTGVFGFITCMSSKTYLPVLWILIVILFDPRSVHRSATIPEALLIAVGLDVVLFHGLSKFYSKPSTEMSVENNLVKNKIIFSKNFYPYLVVFLIFTYSFLLSYFDQINFHPTKSLSNYERDALYWIANNTDKERKVLILPANSSWETDWVSEWFPTITNRHSILTVQGYEWIDNAFKKRITDYKQLVECEGLPESCLVDWSTNGLINFDFLMWPKRSEIFTQNQVNLLSSKNGCFLEYQNPDVVIYKCVRD